MHRRKVGDKAKVAVEKIVGASTGYMDYRCRIHLYTYLLEADDNYQILKPKNNELTFAVMKSFRLGTVQNGALFEHIHPAAENFHYINVIAGASQFGGVSRGSRKMATLMSKQKAHYRFCLANTCRSRNSPSHGRLPSLHREEFHASTKHESTERVWKHAVFRISRSGGDGPCGSHWIQLFSCSFGCLFFVA